MPSKLQELWQKQKQKIADAAAPHLTPGDTPRFIILAQTKLPNWLGPIPLSAIYGVKKRAVVVTKDNVYVLAMPMLSPTKVSGLVDKRGLDTAQMRRGGMGSIYVGELKLWPMANSLMRSEVDGALERAAPR